MHDKHKRTAQFRRCRIRLYAVNSLRPRLHLNEQKLDVLEVLHKLHLGAVLAGDHFQDLLVKLV